MMINLDESIEKQAKRKVYFRAKSDLEELKDSYSYKAEHADNDQEAEMYRVMANELGRFIEMLEKDRYK